MEVENKSETGAHGVFQHLNFIPNRLFNRIQRAPIEPKKYLRNGSTEVLDNSTKNINILCTYKENKFLESVLLCFVTCHKMFWSLHVVQTIDSQFVWIFCFIG